MLCAVQEQLDALADADTASDVLQARIVSLENEAAAAQAALRDSEVALQQAQTTAAEQQVSTRSPLRSTLLDFLPPCGPHC